MALSAGQVWKGERAESRDPVTGNRHIRVSHHPAPDCACYYTTNGWLADGRRLVFVSLRTGAPNFFLADYEKDDTLQLTDHPALNIRRGSFYVDCRDGLYYWQTPELVRMNLNTRKEEVIWRHPERALVSIPAVNCDGTRLIATVLEHPELDMCQVMAGRVMNLAGAGKTPRQVMLESRSRVIGIKLDSGEVCQLIGPGLLPCGCGYAVWSPSDPSCCWLGAGRVANPGPDIFVLEWFPNDQLRLRKAGPRTDAELFDHVFWSANGRRIMFKYREKAYGEDSMLLRDVTEPLYTLGWVDAAVECDDVRTVPLPFRNTHINYMPGQDWLIGDGGFEAAAEQHVYRIDVRASGCEFTSLAYHGNRFDRNWPYFAEGYHEPNVRANLQGTAISFTCSREGISPDVYVLVIENAAGDGCHAAPEDAGLERDKGTRP